MTLALFLFNLATSPEGMLLAGLIGCLVVMKCERKWLTR